MVRRISKDLKDRIPDLYHNQGHEIKDICKLLRVQKTFVYKILQIYQRYGCTSIPPSGTIHGRRRTLTPIDINFIKCLLSQHHTLYADEIQEQLCTRRGVIVSITTVLRTLRRLHFSNKCVSAHALERNNLLRVHFMNCMGTEAPDPEMLMFCDEAAKNERTSGRRRGWSLVGTRCIQRRCFVRGQRYSILPVLTLDGIIAHDIIEGSVTTEKFVTFLREFVIPLTNPYPGPRSVLVVDNCSIHHAEEIRVLVEDEAHCKLIFLPPYSPDYNPIEQAFSSIKAYLRRHWHERTLSVIDHACHQITPAKAASYFRASGYM